MLPLLNPLGVSGWCFKSGGEVLRDGGTARMHDDSELDQQDQIEVDGDHQFSIDMHINGTPGKMDLPVQMPELHLSVQLTRIQTMLIVGIVLL